MKHTDVVQREFNKQAARFESKGLTLSNSAYLQWVIENLNLQSHWTVLDVAAGTGILSRALAPHVKQVVALEMTEGMIERGKQELVQQGITNIVFARGQAAPMPYQNESFDAVVT